MLRGVHGGQVLVSAHPAYVLRNEGYRRTWETILSTIPQILAPRGKGDYSRPTGPELRKTLAQLSRAEAVAIDLETTGLDPFRGKIKTVGLSWRHGQGISFPFDATPKALVSFLRSPCPKVFHNGQFDACWFLQHLGVYPRNVVWDTQLAARLRDENDPASLKVLALSMTDMGPYADEIDQKVKDQGGWENLTFDDLWLYNAKDADATLRLFEQQRLDPYLAEEMVSLLQEQETLVRMRVRGMGIESGRISAVQAEVDSEINGIVTRMRELPAVKVFEGRHGALNPASPQQVRLLMEGCLALPLTIRSRKTQVASTGKEQLRAVRDFHPFVPLLEEYRKTVQIRKNFLVPLAATATNGRLHPEWRLGGTRTWRLACAQPNIQNIPKIPRIRQLFLSKPGHAFIAADYSQAELRVVASLSGEEAMIRAFHAGVDAHTATASALFNVPLNAVTEAQRAEGKRCNFAVVYGISPEGMEQKFGIPVETAQDMLRRLWLSMPAVSAWLEVVEEQAKKEGISVSPFGRVRHLPDAMNGRERKLQAHALRQACNFPPQHAAAELTLRAMVRLDAALPGTLVAQIHDSILLECRSDALDESVGLVRTIMQDASCAPWLKVPLVADVKVGDAWHEMENVDADPEE